MAHTNPLRIAMLTNLFYPVVSGSATHSRGLARALTELGHHVIVITAHVDKTTPRHEVIDGFEVYRIPAIRLPQMPIALNFSWLSWTLWPKNLRRIKNILKQHDIQLMHIHNHMFDMALSGVLLQKQLKIPSIVTIHTVIRHNIRLFNLLLYPADRVILRHAVMRHIKSVICPDENVKQYVREAFGRKDGAIIPYGISLPSHPGSDIESQIVEQFQLAGKRIFLSLGNVNVFRNRLTLIRAVAEIRTRFPDFLLLIVGAMGDQRSVDLVKELQLEETVRFTGAQPHEHISIYHKLAELEGMWFEQVEADKHSIGIAAMEAMLAGKPVLTVSNINTFGENMLKNHQNIVNLKSGDKEEVIEVLCQLLENPDKSHAIGEQAKYFASEHFTWPKIAAKTAAIYQSHIAVPEPEINHIPSAEQVKA